MNRQSALMNLRTFTAIVSLAVLTLQGCVPLVAAGVGTGVAATIDRRSYGMQVADNEIELKLASQIRGRYNDTRARVNVTSYNRWLLLTGQVADDAAKADVERIARAFPNVAQVFNELTVGWPASLTTRSNDTLITSNLKARLINTDNISANDIKVVTERNVAYLMGLVSQREAQIAVDVARTTKGVERVVQVFEVISDEEARRLSANPPAEQSGQSAPAAR
ncbi:MAG: BON domain-containing protein [Rhodocyclaceae bacterium]